MSAMASSGGYPRARTVPVGVSATMVGTMVTPSRIASHGWSCTSFTVTTTPAASRRGTTSRITRSHGPHPLRFHTVAVVIRFPLIMERAASAAQSVDSVSLRHAPIWLMTMASATFTHAALTTPIVVEPTDSRMALLALSHTRSSRMASRKS